MKKNIYPLPVNDLANLLKKTDLLLSKGTIFPLKELLYAMKKEPMKLHQLRKVKTVN